MERHHANESVSRKSVTRRGGQQPAACVQEVGQLAALPAPSCAVELIGLVNQLKRPLKLRVGGPRNARERDAQLKGLQEIRLVHAGANFIPVHLRTHHLSPVVSFCGELCRLQFRGPKQAPSPCGERRVKRPNLGKCVLDGRSLYRIVVNEQRVLGKYVDPSQNFADRVRLWRPSYARHDKPFKGQQSAIERVPGRSHYGFVVLAAQRQHDASFV